MKIVMIFDQIQSGLGTKDDTMVPLTGKKEAVGPAVMMQPFLKEIDGRVTACLCCGNGTYLADPDEVSRKLCAMVRKLQPDVAVCGPAFCTSSEEERRDNLWKFVQVAKKNGDKNIFCAK